MSTLEDGSKTLTATEPRSSVPQGSNDTIAAVITVHCIPINRIITVGIRVRRTAEHAAVTAQMLQELVQRQLLVSDEGIAGSSLQVPESAGDDYRNSEGPRSNRPRDFDRTARGASASSPSDLRVLHLADEFQAPLNPADIVWATPGTALDTLLPQKITAVVVPVCAPSKTPAALLSTPPEPSTSVELRGDGKPEQTLFLPADRVLRELRALRFPQALAESNSESPGKSGRAASQQVAAALWEAERAAAVAHANLRAAEAERATRRAEVADAKALLHDVVHEMAARCRERAALHSSTTAAASTIARTGDWAGTIAALADAAVRRGLVEIQLRDAAAAAQAQQALLDAICYRRHEAIAALELQGHFVRVVAVTLTDVTSGVPPLVAPVGGNGGDATAARAMPIETGQLTVIPDSATIAVTTPAAGARRYEFARVFVAKRNLPHRQEGATPVPHHDNGSSTTGRGMNAADDDGTPQRIFHAEVWPMLLQCLAEREAACMIAYGPTGSGKTHTMLGPATADGGRSGIVAATIERLLALGASLRVGVSELYNEQLFDLLAEAAPPVSARDRERGFRSSHRSHSVGGRSLSPPVGGLLPVPLTVAAEPSGGLRAVGQRFVRVASSVDAGGVVETAAQRRRTHATASNARSSRSHMIIELRVTAPPPAHPSTSMSHATSAGVPQSPSPARSGAEPEEEELRWVFVDLAGSERVSRSGSTGERLREARDINRSLAALGDVIEALARPALAAAVRPAAATPLYGAPHHVPYRNSRLTQLLQPCLSGISGRKRAAATGTGGGTRTLFVTCVPPHDARAHNLHEIQSTLAFATRVRAVRTAAP